MKKEIDLEKELYKFKGKLRKYYISTMTSKQYKYPADSKELAELNWIQISIFFDGVMKEMFNKDEE